jgi:RimJ/RimL family protein N-acetyltransferase
VDTLAGLHGDVARGHDDGTGWFVCLRDGTLIGDCGWAGGPGPDGTAEIGYGLAGPFRGREYGTEAVDALVAWALAQPGCTGLVARVLADNPASRRILERHGFGLDRVDGGWLWYATRHEP